MGPPAVHSYLVPPKAKKRKTTPRSSSSPGDRLRGVRERLGMTMRDVENASRRLASARRKRELAIPASRLCEIESNTSVPSIFRLYSLSVVYRLDVSKILQWYGLGSRHDGARRDVEPEPDNVAAGRAKSPYGSSATQNIK